MDRKIVPAPLAKAKGQLDMKNISIEYINKKGAKLL
jgi:hypothetical protein